MRGRVIKTTGRQYWVHDESGNEFICSLKGNIRLRDYKHTNPVVVGDWVDFSETLPGEGVIEDLEERHNYIIRRSIKLSKQSHIIAANIDQALLVVTLSHPKTHLEFIDRYLVTAGAYHISVVIVINKTDLYSKKKLKDEMHKLIDLYTSIGYECIPVSAEKDSDFSELEAVLTGKTSLISGHSGVGKSTLINRIDPNLDLKTTEISEYHKMGKHTTTFAEMHPLRDIGYIIDTPGIKGLGVVDIPRGELSHYFPEMLSLLDKCKFHNCVHIDEPSCAVKEAVEKGKIAISRYRSYLSMYDEEADSFRKDVYR